MLSEDDKARAWTQWAWSQGKPRPASLEQRIKSNLDACLGCGEEQTDPAHLTPRLLGRFDLGDRVKCGCGEGLCIIPLCRSCHAGYDGQSKKQVKILRSMLVPELARPEHRALRRRLLREGPATFAGLLKITQEEIHPELKHALGHLQAVTFGFPELRRMLLHGSRIFREDPVLEARLAEIRELQKRGRL